MKRFLVDESGVTAIEYGVIGAALAAVLLVSAPLLATAISGKFSIVKTALK